MDHWKEALFLIAYGLLLNGALFTTFFWGQIAFRAIRDSKYSYWRVACDTYSVIAISMTLSSLGTGLLFGSRMYDSLDRGVWTAGVPGTLGYVILGGLFTIVLSLFGFMWSHRLSSKSPAFGFMIFMSVVWILFASWWTVFDPANVMHRLHND